MNMRAYCVIVPPAQLGSPLTPDVMFLLYFALLAKPEQPDNLCVPNPCGPFSTCRTVQQRPVCECLPGYYGAPPQCHPECVTNSDCPKYLACVNEKCVDPCVGTCGHTAVCQVVNHNPLCSCPRGYDGDPYIQCRLKSKPACPHLLLTL